MQYYSYDDFLVFLEDQNSEWDLTQLENLKVTVLRALTKVINLQHTTEVTCTYPIVNCMVELPYDVYRIERSSLPYTQRGNYLHFGIATGSVEITYKSYPLENNEPTIPENTVDYVCAMVELRYAKNAWLRQEINQGQFDYFTRESNSKLRAAKRHLPSRQEFAAALFMQKFGSFVSL